MNTTLQAAQQYTQAGLSIIPIRPKDKKPALAKWQPYQERLPAQIELLRWFKNECNIAIIGGKISGNLLIIDFDHQAEDIYPAWQAMSRQQIGAVVDDLPVVKTGKGYHVYVRCQEPGGNQKLALDGQNVLIETRGAGGYVLAPPSVHPSGARYQMIAGDLSKIPTLTADQHAALISCCQFFDAGHDAPAPPPAPAPSPVVVIGADPQLPNGAARKDAYIQAAIKNELAAVANAPNGDRNNQLFRSAAALGEMVGAGWLSENDAASVLEQAAAGIGLIAEEAAQTRKTIASGINKGSKKPRVMPAPAPAPLPAGKKSTDERPDLNIQHPKTADFFKALNHLGYSFKLNILDDTILVNDQPITEGTVAIMKNRMRDLGLSNKDRIADAWVELAYSNEFHPVKDYLGRLQWDGTDHIGNLVSNYTEEVTGLGAAAFRRWMIGAVAKIFEQAQNVMMVWDGKQDLGKSTMARWLCPLPEYFIEGPIKPDDKDYHLRLCNKWVWEVSELQSTTRRADREALKGFITTQEVTVRKAYGRYDIVKPAMVSLLGTINEDGGGFLTDPTGNRRYLIINLQDINHAYSKELDPARLWAQAYALYKAGERWRLSPEEKARQQEINANYQMSSVFEILFWEHFTYEKDKPDQYVTTAEILKTLEDGGLKGNQQANLNELGRLMKKIGARRFQPRVGGKRPVAYAGIRQFTPVNEAETDESIPF